MKTKKGFTFYYFVNDAENFQQMIPLVVDPAIP